MNTTVREKSNETGLALKKKVIRNLFELYLELKKPIEDDAITKMFLIMHLIYIRSFLQVWITGS